MRGLDIVYKAIDRVNEESDPDDPIIKAPETALLAEGSQVDSLKLVNLIASAEDVASEVFGREIVLMSEDAFSSADRPFASVQALATYIDSVIPA